MTSALFSEFSAHRATRPACPIVYTREQLLGLRDSAFRHSEKPVIPLEIRRRRRGSRGGRKRKRRPYLPSIIMGNVRSISNKTEELTALVRHQREYRQCGLMCFSETWLCGNIPDSVVALEGFKLVRADRCAEGSGKSKGGGVAVYVNEQWCIPTHVHVVQRTCTQDLELLAVSMRPRYLPREFSHTVVLCAYIPPSADAAAACEEMHRTVTQIQTRSPRALILISGDFNHASLSATLPTFKQYVTCPTRGNKTLDLLYVNVRDAYASSPLPDALITAWSVCLRNTHQW
ncbi:unnamed protein product [Knipowitschia caucasica]